MKSRTKRQHHYTPFQRRNRHIQNNLTRQQMMEIVFEESEVLTKLRKHIVAHLDYGSRRECRFFPNRERVYSSSQGGYANVPTKMSTTTKEFVSAYLDQVGISYEHITNVKEECIGFQFNPITFIRNSSVR